MFKDLLAFPWVLVPKKYESTDDLLSRLEEFISPAHAKSIELEERRKAIERQA